MTKLIIIALTGLLVLGASACGDDDDDDDDLFSPTATEGTASATSTQPAATSSPDDDDNGDDDGGGDDDDDDAVIDLSLFYPRLTEDDFELVGVERQIDDTPGVGAAALELLIEGPTQEELDSLEIEDPIPKGTELLSLNIEDGVATADFSSELTDFGGGSLNVRTIEAMITETLEQFPTVEEVVILVEGEPDQLQP